MVQSSSMYLGWPRVLTLINAIVYTLVIARVPHGDAANAPPSALKPTAAQNEAAVSQLLDAAERLVVFLAMHPERAAASGQGLGLAVALGAIQSRREVRGSGSISSGSAPSDSFRFPASLRTRLASFENALQTILTSLRNHPRRAELGVRLLNPLLWSFPASVQLPLPRAREVGADAGAEDDPEGKAAAVLLELRALRPAAWAPPTPEQSDACMAQLLMRRRCGGCLHAFFHARSAPAAGYALTHRLLFLLAARQVGCVDVPRVDGAVAVRHLCSLMLNEAERIASLGFPQLLKDLFVEQVTLCGLIGFREFLRPSWKNAILDWQRSAGCFGNSTAQTNAIRPFLVLGDTRGDADLGGGCLSHLTDVATGALGVHLSQFV